MFHISSELLTLLPESLPEVLAYAWFANTCEMVCKSD